MSKLYINGFESDGSFGVNYAMFGGFIESIEIDSPEVRKLQSENKELKKELDETKKELEEVKKGRSEEVGQVHLGLVVEGLEKAIEKVSVLNKLIKTLEEQKLTCNIDTDEIANVIFKMVKKKEGKENERKD